MYENVRPQKCFEAVTYLLNKPLFRQYVSNGIDEEWLTRHIPNAKNTNWVEFLHPEPVLEHSTGTEATTMEFTATDLGLFDHIRIYHKMTRAHTLNCADE